MFGKMRGPEKIPGLEGKIGRVLAWILLFYFIALLPLMFIVRLGILEVMGLNLLVVTAVYIVYGFCRALQWLMEVVRQGNADV